MQAPGSNGTTAVVSRKEVPAAAETEVLLVTLGRSVYGLALDHVRYIAPMSTEFANSGPNAEDYFVFDGNPLAYVSLWDKLGATSQYAEYEELQAMLPLRQQDHLDWMSALETSIRTGIAFGKARDPHQCAFGKWYYAYQPKDRQLGMLLSQFEHPHALIHRLADTLLDLAERGRGTEALKEFEAAKNTTLATLMDLFASARELVVELQRRVAVIVDDGEDTCALGADGVRDIVAIPAARIKPSTNASAHATSALIILEDQSVVPLLNWRIFGTDQQAAETPADAVNARHLL